MKASYFNNFIYSPDINNNDNFNFKYGRGENYCLDFMPYNIYNRVKCLSVVLRQFMFK